METTFHSYTRLKLLGQGSFGKVYLLRHPQTLHLLVDKAIDLTDMEPAQRQLVMKEANILRSLNHPNITQFQGTFLEENTLHILMEYAEKGDLASFISKHKKDGEQIAEERIVDWLIQLCEAVSYIHDKRVIHRDIKSQNIFVSSTNTLKVGDFGISAVLSSTNAKVNTVIGSPYNISPEVINNEPYSSKADIWSLGTVLYELCTLERPFEGNSIQAIAFKIVRGEYRPLSGHLSRSVKGIVESMLQVVPERRPRACEVLGRPEIGARKFELERLKLKMDQQRLEALRRNLLMKKVKEKSGNNGEVVEAGEKRRREVAGLKKEHRVVELPLTETPSSISKEDIDTNTSSCIEMKREKSGQDIICKLKRSKTLTIRADQQTQRNNQQTQRNNPISRNSKPQIITVFESPYEVLPFEDELKNNNKAKIPLHLSLNHFRKPQTKKSCRTVRDQSCIQSAKMRLEGIFGVEVFLSLYRAAEAEYTKARTIQNLASSFEGEEAHLVERNLDFIKQLLQMERELDSTDHPT